MQTLAKLGVGVVLLDECHHLASLWGYVVRAVLGELPEDVHVIGLTATPPVSLPAAEAELYDALLGPVDFTVPTPAVVRDGHLAPYQELAWLTEPLSVERDWLAEHDTRFRELITALHDDADFPEWVLSRVRDRRRSADDDAELSWAEFQKRSPKLARAGIRFLLSGGLQPPTGAPRGEAYRQPPDLEDWLVLLEDYALRCLAPQGSREASGALRRDRRRAARARLPAHPQGRPPRHVGGRPAADRLAGQVARAGRGARAPSTTRAATRCAALVLCDAELAAQRPDDALTGVLDPAAGTARHALLAIAADDRTARDAPAARLRPRPALRARTTPTSCWRRCAPPPRSASRCRSGRPSPDGLLISLRSSRRRVDAARLGRARHRLLIEGTTRVLVGTRALLGEGWNCPPLNVLVDMTVATTGVSVQQMRGRSLRLDPADPEKVASNWDVVCVAPDLTRGSADYERFVRKHLHLFAPAEDGEVEAGPSHVHPELGPFAPPPIDRFHALNTELVARATDRAAARERWQIGTPYRGVELPTLLVRRTRRRAIRHRRTTPSHAAAELSQRVPIASGVGGAAAFGALGVATGAAALLGGLALAPAGLAWAAVRLREAKKRMPLVLPLDAAARAVADAYRELGEMTDEAAASLRIEPRASGYLRCELTRGDARGGQAVRGRARRAGQRLRRPALPRLAPARRSAARRDRPARARADAAAAVRRAAAPVPADLARRKERAEAFARAWRRHVGPGRLVFTQRSDEGRELRAEAASVDGGYETMVRDVWV